MDKTQIVSEIQASDVISFDIFDTLIYRPFTNPADVFLHLEKIYHKQNFKQNRVEGEAKARSLAAHEEITLDDIYACMPAHYQEMLEIEVNFEIDCSQPHVINLSYYHHACEQNKTIVMTSDMYLPKVAIERILAKHDLHYHLLLVSSEEKKTKSTGALFQRLKAIYPLKKLVHLGDNKHSDFDKANSNGLKGIYLPKLSEQYFEVNKRHAKLFEKLNENTEEYLAHSVNVMLCAAGYILNKVQNAHFWLRFGYLFAGPMLLGFTQYIHNKVIQDQVLNLMFIARDGYFIKAVYDSLYGDEKPKSVYVYAQRKVISQLVSDKKELDFIQSLKLNRSENTMLVDVGSCNFTSQRFLQNYFLNLKGVYWVTGGAKYENLRFEQCYDLSCKEDHQFMKSGLIEFFMTSTEAPVIGLESNNNFNPLYTNAVTNEERVRIEALKEIEKGIMKFVQQYKQINLGVSCYFTPTCIIELNNLWLKQPTINEIKHLSKIKHASASEHEEYMPMFTFNRKSINYWLSKVL